MKRTKRKTPKVLFPLYMEIEQHAYITRKSEETGKPKAAIVREWVDRCIKEEQKQKA